MEQTALSNKFGGERKWIYFILYLAFFVMHTVIAAFSYLPSIDPNELSAVAIAQFYTGGDWSAVMSKSSYFYGILQPIIYIPAMLLTKDPFIQYRIMVITNGIVLSFIPLIVFSCCRMLGAKKDWQAVLTAICCGGWMTYIVHGKFIWNETAAVFMPWLTLFVLLKADSAKRKGSRLILSFLLGLVCALSYCAHERLFALILAVVVTVLLLRFVYKRKSINLTAFFISLAVFGFAAVIANYFVMTALWKTDDPADLLNTAENFFCNLSQYLSGSGIYNFFSCLFSQIYYFICASWGIGALAIALFIIGTVNFFKSRRQKTDPAPIGMEILRCFSFFLILFMLFISVCYRFGAENLDASQSALLFGRYLDGVIPFAVLFVLMYFFTSGIDLYTIMYGIITISAGYILFFFFGRERVLDAYSAGISSMLGLYPVMFGESAGSLLTSTGITAAVSCSTCIMAVILVIYYCAKKHANLIISIVLTAAVLYSGIFGTAFYLPLANAESIEKNAPYTELCEYVFNNKDAPGITVFKCSRSCAMTIQYLNQNVTVYTAESEDEIFTDTFIIAPKESVPHFEREGRFITPELIGETDDYCVYAYGERARAYAQSQMNDAQHQQQ